MRIMMTAITLLVAYAASLPAVANSAERLDAATQRFCEKMKECARAEMGDVPPEMRPMMEQMLEGMCANAVSQYQSGAHSGGTNQLVDDAARCIDSMASQSCAALDDGEETAACRTYQRNMERRGYD